MAKNNEVVTLSKDVAGAIEQIRSVTGGAVVYDLSALRHDTQRGNNLTKIITDYVDVYGPEPYFSALVNGYRVEQTAEEKLAEYYGSLMRGLAREDNCGKRAHMHTRRKAVEKTLDILGITIGGINGDHAKGDE